MNRTWYISIENISADLVFCIYFRSKGILVMIMWLYWISFISTGSDSLLHLMTIVPLKHVTVIYIRMNHVRLNLKGTETYLILIEKVL